MSHHVLILGGGIGGVSVARALRNSLPATSRVTVVEREAAFVFQPSLLWLITGDRRAEQISRPMARVANHGIELVRGDIETIDPSRREVVVAGRTLAGDSLVIALGAELAEDAIPGLAEAGHDFYSLAGAERLRTAFADFKGGRLVVLTATPAYKCPAAPYEAAMLLEAACRRRGLRERTQIDLFAAEPGPMGVAGPEVSKAVRGMIEAKNIAYHPEHQIAAADPEARLLTFAAGASADFDLLAYVPPHRAPRVVREAGLVDDSGWIPVDRHTMQTKHEGVYAIGDVATIPLAIGKPLPKAGVFARGEAEIVAHNLARAITGKGKPETFDGAGACFIETGDGKAGFGDGNFYAEPRPDVKFHRPGRRWHLGKVLVEKDWLLRQLR